VTVCVESAGEAAAIVDGVAMSGLQVGDRLVISKNPHVSRFVRLYDRRQVYETLMERLKPREVEKPDDAS
jgi:hypothetical protein